MLTVTRVALEGPGKMLNTVRQAMASRGNVVKVVDLDGASVTVTYVTTALGGGSCREATRIG